jgi:N4-gp56 family major capsid protein
MASVTYGVNDAETNKILSKALYHAIIPESFFHKRGMVGGEGSLITLKDDLAKEGGDRVRNVLVDIVDGPGKGGSEVLEGDEEAYDTFTDDLLIDELRNAVKIPARGTIEQQRVLFDCRKAGFETRKKWFTKRLNEAMFNQICANQVTGLATKRSGSNAVPVPDGDHIIRPNGAATDQAITSAETFTLRMIDVAVERSQVFQDEFGKQLFEPLNVEGEELFVLFLHTYQARQLREDATTAGNWYDIQARALQGGQISQNPIFTGALGIYNRTLIYETPYVPVGNDSSSFAAITTVRRAAFCGAGAACLAFGQGYGEDTFRWNEKDDDYGKKLGVSATTVWGVKRTIFNSSNLAVIQMPTYATAGVA